jgi:hypothetical protein
MVSTLKNGTWFVKMKIDNEELWQDIKSKKIKGLSIEGYFTDKFEANAKEKANRLRNTFSFK